MPLSFSCDSEEEKLGTVKALVKGCENSEHFEVLQQDEDVAKPCTPLLLVTATEVSITEKKITKHVCISEEDIIESAGLRQGSVHSGSPVDSTLAGDPCLVMTGTIQRGKKKSQSIDVVLNMSREELESLEATITKEKDLTGVTCTSSSGVHVMLWSLLCVPFSFLLSSVNSFFTGTITWYNIFMYLTEEKSILHRIVLAPVLILSYPFIIVLFSFSLGLYACISQLSFHWTVWLKEISDFEKGFYGWICNVLDLPDCSPYEVVVLSGVHPSSSVS